MHTGTWVQAHSSQLKPAISVSYCEYKAFLVVGVKTMIMNRNAAPNPPVNMAALAAGVRA